MPILDPASIPGVALDLEIATQLPDYAAIRDAATPASMEAAARSWRRRGSVAIQQATQQTLGGIVTNVGIPLGELRTVGGQVVEVARSLGGAWKVDTSLISVAKELLDDAAMTRALKESTILVASQIASAVPIIGAIIEMGVSIIRLAIKATRDMAARDREATVERALFTPERDLAVYTELFRSRVTYAKDWTGLYLPPSREIAGGQVKYAFDVKEITGGGWRITPGAPDPQALGQVPGSNYLHQALEFDREGLALDTGTYLPSANQQASWLWGQIASGGPSLFTLNVSVGEGAWEQYFSMLSRWASAGHIKGKRRDALSKWWSARGVTVPLDRVITDKELSALPPVKAFAAIRDAQLASLKRTPEISCYVTRSYGALQVPAMRVEVERVRREVLASDASSVDLDNVPDLELRAEIRKRQRPGGGLQIAAAGRAKPAFSSVLRTSPTTTGSGSLLTIAGVAGAIMISRR